MNTVRNDRLVRCGIRALISALACLAPIVAGPRDLRAQGNSVTGTIRGRVVDESTRTGIATVLVEFMDGRTRVRASAVSDDEGGFVIANLPRGSFRLRASRIGYVRTITPYWRIESGEVLTVTLYMDAEAVVLAPLEITARERSRSPVLAGYLGRLDRRIGGTFITREEIERRNPSLVSDLLTTVPGVRLSPGGTGANSRSVSITHALPIQGRSCPVQIWVDGMLATRSNVPVPIDELATPGDLVGIEIYRGLATLPPEFVTPEARCGVIALWTRRGG